MRCVRLRAHYGGGSIECALPPDFRLRLEETICNISVSKQEVTSRRNIKPGALIPIASSSAILGTLAHCLSLIWREHRLLAEYLTRAFVRGKFFDTDIPMKTKYGRRVVHMTSVHRATDMRIFHRECCTLAQSGYDVVLIAPGAETGLCGGVRIRTVSVSRNRFQRMTKTAWQVFRSAWSERAAVYHFHDPELMPFALLLRLRKAKVVFDVHEDIPNDIATKPWIYKRFRAPLSKFAAFFLNVVNVGYSAIVAATPAISRRFSHPRTVLVQNFPILEKSPDTPVQPYDERPLNCIYQGSISHLRGIEEMVRAFDSRQLRTAAHFVLMGEFENSTLERSVRRLPGWDNTVYLGHCPIPEVTAALGTVRVGLLLFQPAPNHLESYPNKLFEYMAAGLPVIASNFPLWREIIEDASCGILVDPLNVSEISNAIDHLLSNPTVAKEMGERGQATVINRYRWAGEATKLNALYAELTA